MTKEMREFIHGFAVAIGSLARDHDQPSMAADIMRSNGVTLAHMREAGVESFDLPRALLREFPGRRLRAK